MAYYTYPYIRVYSECVLFPGNTLITVDAVFSILWYKKTILLEF